MRVPQLRNVQLGGMGSGGHYACLLWLFRSASWHRPSRFRLTVLPARAATGFSHHQPYTHAPQVGLKKYSKVNQKAFGLNSGKKRIVVLRTSGAILGEQSRSSVWRVRCGVGRLERGVDQPCTRCLLCIRWVGGSAA